MNKKQKKVLIRIIVAAVLMIALSVIPVVPSKGVIRFVLFMIPYLVIGYDILRKAFKGILNRQVFDENFLMAFCLETMLREPLLCCFTRSVNFFRVMQLAKAAAISVN